MNDNGDATRRTNHGVDMIELDPATTRDLTPEVMGDDGRMRVLPAAYWAATTMRERALFGHRNGIYSFPTVELVDRLRQTIDNRPAIEIGAGHGVLADALGIPGTDSRQHDDPRYRMIYLASGQPPVRYGPNVKEIHASRAVRFYKPAVVIGCWVTYKWDNDRPYAGGNEGGVDETDVMAHCDTYVFVGNDHTHRFARVLERRPRVEFPDYVYSRASQGGRDMIVTWNRRAARR